MKSKYDSVQEQTGLFAGQGGFDVTVGRHTQLDGTVIASAATAEKNSLDTGTLGFSDIGNAADYKVSHTGISLSGGSSFGSTSGGSMAGGAPAMAASSGHAEGITRAAIGAGTITVRDQDKQQQNIAGLSRDTDNANGSIGPIFDREKEQKRLAAVGLVIEIGSQVSDIAKKQGELNGLKKAREAHPEMTAEQLKDTPEYKKVMAEYGTGSNLQRGIQAATAALQGLAGGNIAGGLAAAAAPELANVLKSTEDKPEVNILAHAILGGAVAAMQGNSVAAGAAGAGVGELAAHGIMATLYPGKEASDLGEEDRQLISTLATISAGMAGGLAGNSTSSAAAGAQAGRNAVENNALSFGSGMDSYVNAAASWNQYAAANGLTSEETQAGLDKLAKGDFPDGANITKAIVDGYQDGMMIAGAWYLGPAASVGKVIGGGMLALSANGGYQYYDLKKPGNENKSWDYLGSATSFTTGILAPGRGILANTGIAVGSTLFVEGTNTNSLIASGSGAFIGGGFGKYAPVMLTPVFGNSTGFVGDVGSAFMYEVISNGIKNSSKNTILKETGND